MTVTVEQLRDHAFRLADEARSGSALNWAAKELFFVAFHAVCRECGKVPTNYVDNHGPLIRELEAEGRAVLAKHLAALERLRVRAVEYPPDEDFSLEDVAQARVETLVVLRDLGLEAPELH